MNNLLQYLEAAAQHFPNKTAVSDGTLSLSYSRLVSLAKCVGCTIKAKNAAPSPVCVLAERSAMTLVYFFGILYSGNFYVPMDPDMPTEKMQLIVDDCRPIAVCGKFPDGVSIGGAAILTLVADELCGGEAEVPELPADAPAYMVYTSGSTGTPKGVLKSHGAVISFVEAYCKTFDFSQDEIIGSQTPFFFDASAKDIYLSIRLGATIEIIPIEKFAMPTDLIEYLNEKKITFISWVPTALAIVAQLKTLNYILPQHLRKVFFVGEVMPVKYLNYWREKLPDAQYVNLYGQSELAGVCCYYEVCGQQDNTAVLPMGKPLCNCKLYLLDHGTVINEAGKLGEIFVVSDALALEYYHDPEKTAASFRRMDFGEGMCRCFQSGDLASYDEDGNLLFASRSDFQIKHLGHRIELGEIEAVAGALPEIVRCACLNRAEKQTLVLFAEVFGETVTAKALKSALRQKLSSYMLPEKIRILEKLPINANGKINRQKLKEFL